MCSFGDQKSLRGAFVDSGRKGAGMAKISVDVETGDTSIVIVSASDLVFAATSASVNPT